MLDIKTLEGWLWEAACKIRGLIDGPKYEKFAKEYGDEKTAKERNKV